MIKREELKGYNYIGVRGLAKDEQYNVGDTCRNSFDWDYENDISSFNTENPIELDGACAINTQIELFYDDETEETINEKIEKILKNFIYVGKIAIIGGNSAKCGADANEIIIEDAEVLAII